MNLNDFDFELPEDLIALRPCVQRDLSRLLVVNPNSQPNYSDLIFHDLPSQLRKGDVLVFNNSRTIAANLNGIRKARDEFSHDVSININLHKKQNANSWWAFVKPAKRLKFGDIIEINSGFDCKIIQKLEGGEVLLEFNQCGDKLNDCIDKYGNMPIPPYIGLRRDVDEKDSQDYQTIYSKDKGSVATPTAGLHFTPQLMAKLDEIGIERHELTLHVGAGTFLPVKIDNILEHKMHSEYFEITKDLAQKLNKAKIEGRRIIAVGTTSLRSIESSINEYGEIGEFCGETNIFLYPGKKIKFVDGLISNFHLPKSTLFMLMCAFSGTDFAKNAYKHAIAEKYRFFSYGDGGLWWKSTFV
jgi:S-adenosylmethionine:tRNA ribosyltransferase-isomerase